jgi:hypothetical protein
MKVRHSKYKNTGLIFELLVKQVAADTLNNMDSNAVSLIKKYFTGKSALAKELRLYEFIIKNTNTTATKAENIISTILELSQKIDRNAAKKQRYNLVKEIKESYNESDIFTIKVPHYKALAATYCLLEAHTNPDVVNPEVLIENKTTVLEHLTGSEQKEEEVKQSLLEEYSKYEEDLRLLTYKILLEKFNGEYASLLPEQKNLLKEFISSVDSNNKLFTLVNEQLDVVKKSLVATTLIVEDRVVALKLNEIASNIEPLSKGTRIDDSHLLNLMQYYQLLHEIVQVK